MSLEAPDLGTPNIIVDIRDRVLHLRVNRPERRNAFSQDVYRGLKRAAIWSDRQTEIDSVCLTGTDAWFGSGGDLSGRRDADDLEAEWDPLDHFPFRHMERSRKIWVARINGLCHAGGVDLVLHCDVTIASDRATFRVPELLRGLPDPFMAARLVEAVGLPRAKFLFFTAATIDAVTAQAMGLIGDVVPHDELDDRVEWALAQIRLTGPTARAVMKRELNKHNPPHDPAIFTLVAPEETAEGVAAFLEKRPPRWANL